eukprot:COSAG02_NODE_2437_length_8868_cov_3.900559_2_plen_92_part_00
MDGAASTTTFSLYTNVDARSVTINLDIDAYEIPDFERAISKAAKADSAFWTKANAHLPNPNTTKLVNPDEVKGCPEPRAGFNMLMCCMNYD